MAHQRWKRWFSSHHSRSSGDYDERINVTRQEGPLFVPRYPSLSVQTVSIAAAGKRSLTGSEQRGEEWINEFREKINKKAQHTHPETSCPSIFRVPKHVRRNGDDDNADEAYRPTMVPVGPYHHPADPPKDSDYLAIQNYKWQCVRAILSRHSDNARAGELIDTCLRWLATPSVQATVKEYYSEEIRLGEVELAQILLLDACFVINLLLMQQEKNRKEAASAMDVNKGTQQGEKKTTTVETLVSTIYKTMSSSFEKIYSKKETVITKNNGKINKVEQESTTIVETSHGRSMEGPSKVDHEEKKMEMVVLNINDDDKKIQGPLIEGQWTWNFILYDLLKLENQIPFFVIQNLYDLLKIPGDADELLHLVLDLFSYIRPKMAKNFKNVLNRSAKVYHLLHLFHSSLVQDTKSRTPRISRGRAPERIPSATELRRAMISIKKKKAEEASSFMDVTYDRGAIEIPKLQVYDYSDSLFRNLIAFEQCFPGIKPQDAYVTLYAVLMDCIVDTSQDARLLVSEGILVSRLSSSEAASELFNKLCKDIHYNIQGSYMEDLFFDVNEDYKSNVRQCFATLRRNYCPNSWAVLSVMAAFLLLVLTILQVVYAVVPYYHPRN